MGTDEEHDSTGPWRDNQPRQGGGQPEPTQAEVDHELTSIVADLMARYGGQFDEDTVRRTVYEIYQRIAAHATVRLHLVQLTYNEARDAFDVLASVRRRRP